jgi:hypothetical protein
MGIFPASAQDRTVPWETPRIWAASATFTYSLSLFMWQAPQGNWEGNGHKFIKVYRR